MAASTQVTPAGDDTTPTAPSEGKQSSSYPASTPMPSTNGRPSASHSHMHQASPGFTPQVSEAEQSLQADALYFEIHLLRAINFDFDLVTLSPRSRPDFNQLDATAKTQSFIPSTSHTAAPSSSGDCLIDQLMRVVESAGIGNCQEAAEKAKRKCIQPPYICYPLCIYYATEEVSAALLVLCSREADAVLDILRQAQTEGSRGESHPSFLMRINWSNVQLIIAQLRLFWELYKNYTDTRPTPSARPIIPLSALKPAAAPIVTPPAVPDTPSDMHMLRTAISTADVTSPPLTEKHRDKGRNKSRSRDKSRSRSRDRDRHVRDRSPDRRAIKRKRSPSAERSKEKEGTPSRTRSTDPPPKIFLGGISARTSAGKCSHTYTPIYVFIHAHFLLSLHYMCIHLYVYTPIYVYIYALILTLCA